jgi:ribose transport system permease protein
MNSNTKDLLMRLSSVMALLVLSIILTIATPNFLTANNIMNILRQTSINGLIASGMLVALITGGIDLSVGATAIVSACTMGLLVQRGVTNPFILIVMALAMGVLIGMINGLLLTKLRLPHPFVSTLATKYILAGLALVLTSSMTVAGFPDSLTFLGSYSLFKNGGFSGVPLAFIIVIVIFAAFHVFLNMTALGRKIYCVGGNPEAAKMSGINSDKVLTIVYTISGLMAAMAAVFIVGRTGVANPASAMEPYDTDAIAACIIGGASFFGGKGTIWGTLLGALLISTIRNGLTLLHASSAVQYIVIGFVIIIAVYMDVVRGRLEAEARRQAAA